MPILTAIAPNTREDAIQAVKRTLKHFIGESQMRALIDGTRNEEGQFFIDKIIETAARIEAMPKTYEQNGLGENAIAHLHYFRGSSDFYITEKDSETEQLQAFGTADLGYGPEFGYISIVDLIGMGVELDLYFNPKPLSALQKAA